MFCLTDQARSLKPGYESDRYSLWHQYLIPSPVDRWSENRLKGMWHFHNEIWTKTVMWKSILGNLLVDVLFVPELSVAKKKIIAYLPLPNRTLLWRHWILRFLACSKNEMDRNIRLIGNFSAKIRKCKETNKKEYNREIRNTLFSIQETSKTTKV